MEETVVDQEKEREKFEEVASSVIQGMVPATPEIPILTGRKKIYTNYINKAQTGDDMEGFKILDRTNIVNALNLALRTHYKNAYEIRFLRDYHNGKQNIFNRVKDVRPDVDNRVVINYANTFTRDIIGYTFGKAMQYIARRTDNEESNGINPIKEEVRLLNDYAELNDKPSSDQIKATNCSIYGIAHRGVFANRVDDEDEAPYYYLDLDSECTFVAYSSQLRRDPVFAVTYTKSWGENEDNYVLMTVYTMSEIYMFKIPFSSTTDYDGYIGVTVTDSNLVTGYPKPNPLGILPIVECENNQFRMGHWETAITLMDAINKVGSDSVNDVEQFVNSILVAINAEFSKEQMDNVKANKYAEIRSPQGLNCDLKYIQAQLDGTSVEQLRQYLEDSLRAVVGIPDRKTRGGGGGDTGDAVKLRDGWADMEVVARTTETFNKKSEKKELRVILKILRDLKKISKTSMINVDIKYPRNKTDNLNSKVTAMSTMLGTQTMAPVDVLDIVDITSDNTEVIERGEEYWKKKKQENFEEQQRQLQLTKQMSEGDDNATREGGNKDGKPNSTKSNDSTSESKSTSTGKSTNTKSK
jgi:SPP1 family phage portal protein|nr:MAG TPA: Portal [Caudoviricetes sp.]